METMVRIIKVLQEGNSTLCVAKDVDCSELAVSKVWETKWKGWKRETRKTSKSQDRKQESARNRLKEMGFMSRKAKHKPSVTPKQKKTRLQWAEEKQPWSVDGWMEVIFRDGSVLDKEMMLEL